MRENKVIKNVLVPLTESDRENYGLQMAREFIKRSKLDNVMKKVGKLFREKIQVLDDSLTRLSRITENGEHLKEVECTVFYNFETNKKEYTPINEEHYDIEVKEDDIPLSEQQEEIEVVVMDDEPVAEEPSDFGDDF